MTVLERETLCSHCQMGPREARRRLCSACRKHKQRHGSLPDPETLLDRYERSLGIRLSQIREVPYGDNLQAVQDAQRLREAGYGRKYAYHECC